MRALRFPALRIVAVGRIGTGPEAALCRRYCDRLRPAPVIVEVGEARGTGAEARRREARALLAGVPAGARLIALDEAGQAVDSAGFLGWLEATEGSACFAIGGADGLDPSVIQASFRVLSLGRMTWPHLLARCLLAEQLYRAQCIAAGHPYHHAARP